MYHKKSFYKKQSVSTIKHDKIIAEFVDDKLPISTIISDMIDDFIIYVKETHNCNDSDIPVVSFTCLYDIVSSKDKACCIFDRILSNDLFYLMEYILWYK